MRLAPRPVLRFCAAAALIAATLLPARASADEGAIVYSQYELTAIREALANEHTALEPAPAGKILEGIDIVRLDVIEKRDPAPGFLNVFHATTQPIVIEREVLMRVGEPYVVERAEQTARNLRLRPQLSLVLCLPTKGSRPGTVRLLVITKDVWSIRLSWDLKYADGKLEQLLLQPSEINVAGTHQEIFGNFDLELDTYSLGLAYVNPRLLGEWLSTNASANIVLNRITGDPEGTFGRFEYGKPLYSYESRWAWDATIAWNEAITRRFKGGNLAIYDATTPPAEVPWVYSTDVLTGDYHLIRSEGRVIKHDFWAGMFASRRIFHPRPDLGSQFVDPASLTFYPQASIDEFAANEVPVSDQQIAPYLEYHTYVPEFRSLLNVETLGLQEDVQFGHEIILKVYPVTRALNSTRDFLGFYGAASYAIPLRDGFAKAYVETTTEFAKDIPDGSIEVGGRVLSPTTKFGRLVFDAVVLNRYHNYLNIKTQLGGDTRLRGYPSNEFIGNNLLTANLEFRTRPLELFTFELGAAAFFDSGDAFDSFDQMVLYHGAGFGLRAVIPQLNRVVFRADVGFPLTPVLSDSTVKVGVPNVVVTFSQAFPSPAIPSTY